jgi:putative FmdB family regulatory protein
MPLYEYKCEKCGEINSYIETVSQAKSILRKLFFRKCSNCGSRKLKKIISTFSVHRTQTFLEMVDDLRKMANVQFIPQAPRPPGPPGGVCPYAKEEKKEKETKKEREKIVI